MNSNRREYNDQEYQVTITLAVGRQQNAKEAALAMQEMVASEEASWEYEVENLSTGEKTTVVVF
jgi:hypothetical protein